MIMEVDAPHDITEETLTKLLNETCSKLGVDYSVRKVETYEL